MPTRTLKDLNEAAGQGDLDQVKQIVEQLKDKNPQADIAKIYEVKLAVYKAATNGQLHIMEYICQYIKGNVNFLMPNPQVYEKTIFHSTAEKGHLNVVSFFTNKLSNPNPGLLTSDEFRGRTPLHCAAQQGHLPVVKHICSLLEDKNPKDSNGHTPLHSAGGSGQLHIVEYLIEHIEGDINPSDITRNTVLHYAAQEGHLNVVSLYSNRLTNPNPGKLSNDDLRGFTPLLSHIFQFGNIF